VARKPHALIRVRRERACGKRHAATIFGDTSASARERPVVSAADARAPADPDPAPGAGRPKGGLVAWAGLAILIAMYLVSMLDRSIFSLMVEPVKRDLRLTDTQFGLLQGAAFSIFYVLVGLPLGWLADRYSRRAIIFTGMVVWSVACAACGLASKFVQILLGRAGLGAGEAVLLPSGTAILGDSFPRQRLSLVIGIFKIGAMLGSVISAALGGVLLAWADARGPVRLPALGVLQPWQQVLMLIGLPGVVFAGLAFLLPKSAPRPAAERKLAPFLPYLAQRKAYFATMFIGGALMTVPAYAAGAWGPAVLIRRYHLPIQEVGALSAMIAPMTSVGFLFFGWLSDRMYARGNKLAHVLPGLVVPPILIAANYVAYVLVDELHVYVALMLFCSILITCGGPLDAHVQVASLSAYRARMAALYTASQVLIANTLGPVMVGWFTQHLFHDPARIGWGIATTNAIATPLGMLVLFLGRRSVARAADLAEAADVAQAKSA
jgi:MFS family permease